MEDRHSDVQLAGVDMQGKMLPANHCWLNAACAHFSFDIAWHDKLSLFPRRNIARVILKLGLRSDIS